MKNIFQLLRKIAALVFSSRNLFKKLQEHKVQIIKIKFLR